MLKIEYKSFDLLLKNPFTTSRYTVKKQQTFVVSISCGKYIGFGEATVNPYYESTLTKLEASVQSVIDIVANARNLHPEQLWPKLQALLRSDYFALCAVDCAFWDWYSQNKEKPLRQFWSDKSHKLPLTNYTIGIDSVLKMKQKIKASPWPIYKIKLGTTYDIEIIKELRTITNAVFRVDANCAWTAKETIENSIVLRDLGVEFIEQPLSPENQGEMLKVFEKSKLPIIADEGCQREEDVSFCAPGFHGVNIKLMKCGGITPALRMIAEARKLNLKVMAGCMTESSIGISALCQLAPLLDYIDADGAMLIENDIAKGVSFDNGHLVFVPRDGTGARLIS